MADLNFVTAGESHGPALTAVVTGLPSGLTLDLAHLNQQLARRQAGYGRSPRQRIETDTAAVTSGVRHGVTIGGPIAMQIKNADHGNWDRAMAVWPTNELQGNWRDRVISLPRPGHADLGGMARGAFNDLRPVLERSSARETAARVGCGALAQQFLLQLGITVRAHVRSIGAASSQLSTPGGPNLSDGWSTLDQSELCCLDPAAEAAMIAEIDAAKAERDTLGGIVEVVAYGLPPGIGGYTTAREKLDGRIAGAVMSVQAMKGVEFGDGFAVASRRGSQAHDQMHPHAGGQGMGVVRPTNHAGGIEGGMSNGAPIVVRAVMKPLPTLMRPLDSVDLATGQPTKAHAERSDVCAVPAAAIVLEAAVAFELAAVIRMQFGSQAMVDVSAGMQAYRQRVDAVTA